MYLGTFNTAERAYFFANTHNPATGEAVDADTDPTYRIYRADVGTLIVSGSMTKLDDPNTTGFYEAHISTAGLLKDKVYVIYVQATVNSITVTTHHTFQINASVRSDTQTMQTAAANTVRDAILSAVVENNGSLTFTDMLRLMGAVLFGRTSNQGSTFLTADGAKTRVTAITNQNNERTSITVDPTD